MPYNINKSNGIPLVTIPDNTIDVTTSSLSLVGRNAFNFGQGLNNNFVGLIQHFSKSSPPINPLQGQLWYNQTKQLLSVYDGSRWSTWSPPFDGKTGIASVNLTSVATILFATVYQNQIISITSNKTIPSNLLPSYVLINGIQYNFEPLFSNGIVPGINIPFQYANDFTYGTSNTDNASEFNNTIGINGIISTANKFSNFPIFTLAGALIGNVQIIGNSNVNLVASMSNVYIGNSNITIHGVWSKVQVSNVGLVSNVYNVNTSDIFTALTYPTIDSNLVSVSNTPGTMVARDTNANFKANIMFGTSTSTFSFSKPFMLGIHGDVIGSVSFDGSSNVTIETSRATVNNLTAGKYNVLNVNNTGRVLAAMLVDNVPIGSLVLIQSNDLIPPGWVLCYGQTITLPSGGTITAPNLTNITVLGNRYIMRIS